MVDTGFSTFNKLVWWSCVFDKICQTWREIQKPESERKKKRAREKERARDSERKI